MVENSTLRTTIKFNDENNVNEFWPKLEHTLAEKKRVMTTEFGGSQNVKISCEIKLSAITTEE